MPQSRYICIPLLFVLTIFASLKMSAQSDASSLKSEVNQIKKNSLYIYGEGVAETYEDAEKLAEARFLENLTEYIKSVPDLDEADIVIVPPIRQEMKKITFDRTAKRKVTFLYILKSEVVPLMTDDHHKKISPVNEQPDTVINRQLPDVEDIDLRDVIDDEVASIASQCDTIVSPSAAAIVSGTVDIISDDLANEDAIINFDGLSDKELSIVQKIIELESFDKISDYLINRKASRHDILYKGCNSFDMVTDPGFWIVFSSNREVIAILDKDKESKIYSKISERSDFNRNGKIWLKIK